jgi:hypothetical protein
MVKFRETVEDSEAVKGDHLIERHEKIVKEYNDKDNRRDELFREIIEQINTTVSRVTDYDSGYMEVANSTSYTVTHNLGRIPTRIVFYFSASDEPQFEGKTILIESNIQVSEMIDNSFKITTPSDFGGSGSGVAAGFLRVVLWR